MNYFLEKLRLWRFRSGLTFLSLRFRLRRLRSVEIFTGASVSDPGALEDPPLILTNLGLFLPHNLRPALISLGCTIYDLAGFGSAGYMGRFGRVSPVRRLQRSYIRLCHPLDSGRRITRAVWLRTWGTCRWRRREFTLPLIYSANKSPPANVC